MPQEAKFKEGDFVISQYQRPYDGDKILFFGDVVDVCVEHYYSDDEYDMEDYYETSYLIRLKPYSPCMGWAFTSLEKGPGKYMWAEEDNMSLCSMTPTKEMSWRMFGQLQEAQST